MVVKYAKKAHIKEAENSLSQSRKDKTKSWAWTIIAAPFILLGTILIWMGNGCQAQAETANNRAEQHKQKAQQIINDSREEWKREVRRERVDSDSISITSSEHGDEYGEVVDVA